MALLGRFLLGGTIGPSSILEARAAGLKPEHLFHPVHGELCGVIFDAANDGHPVDHVSIAEVCKSRGIADLGDVIELGKLIDVGHAAANVAEYSRRLIELATRRRMIAALHEGAMALATESETPEQVSAAVQRAAEAGHVHKDPTLAESVRDAFSELMKLMQSDGRPVGVETGFADLDRMTRGLKPGNLAIIAARPSMGKTALVLNMICHMAVWRQAHMHVDASSRPRRVPVLLFELEMTTSECLQRMIVSEAKVSAQRMASGNLIAEELNDLMGAADRINASPLAIIDRGGITITEIQAKARLWRQRHQVIDVEKGTLEPAVIIIDYLQLVRGTRPRYDSREREVSEISGGLKELAKELGVPIIALSQLNRAVDSRPDHRPVMSDLRESGSLEQDADIVMFIYRAERYLSADATDEERTQKAGKAELIIVKQRSGPIGTVHLGFNGDIARFTNVEKNEY